jgi:CRISPR/Cas system CSM-associated protein Csm2 small subunit
MSYVAVGVPGFKTADYLEYAAAMDMLTYYTDVLDPREHEKELREARQQPSLRRYAPQLQSMAAVVGQDRLRDLADRLVAGCTTVVGVLGVEVTVYGQSRSWGYWDLAKQHYFARHPEKATEKYRDNLTDPTDTTDPAAEKRVEILTRHIGWEIEQALTGDRLRQAIVSEEWSRRLCAQHDRSERNESDLRSYELTRLGRLGIQAAVHTAQQGARGRLSEAIDAVRQWSRDG